MCANLVTSAQQTPTPSHRHTEFELQPLKNFPGGTGAVRLLDGEPLKNFPGSTGAVRLLDGVARLHEHFFLLCVPVDLGDG